MPEKRSAVEPRLVTRRRLLSMFDDYEMRAVGSLRVSSLLPGDLPGEGWEWLPRSAVESGTGLVLVDMAGERSAIAPPFPVTEAGEHSGFDRVRELLNHPRTVALVLLRLGSYAVGVAEDEHVAVSKTGGRYVKGRHRAGGQSQRRFERNREKWVRELFDEVCEVSRSRFEAYEKPIDWLALGGDRQVLGQFMNRCRMPRDLAERTLPWRPPIDKPGRSELESAVTAVWSSRMYSPPATVD
ncbi:MAG: Vms1/Ankzf1 family peptidyl-tRNA hydrolase [Dehalococcoidia bacterium]